MNMHTEGEVNVKETIIKLNREQLLAICESYDKHESARDVVEGRQTTVSRLEANEKARKICYEGIPPWGLRVNENVNAIIRAAYREGPMDTYKLSTLMATVEHWTIAELAKDGLTEVEHRLLAGPVAGMLAAAAENPDVAAHVAPVGRQTSKTTSTRKRALVAATVTTEAPPAEPSLAELAQQFGLAQETQTGTASEDDGLAEFEALLGGEEVDPVEETVAAIEAGILPVATESDDDFFGLMESA